MSSKEIEKIWLSIAPVVFNNIKVFFLEHNVGDIIHHFSKRIDYVVRRYSKYLPQYVAESELDDLKTISNLEFLETLKVWNPLKNDDICSAIADNALKLYNKIMTRDYIIDYCNYFVNVMSGYYCAENQNPRELITYDDSDEESKNKPNNSIEGIMLPPPPKKNKKPRNKKN